MHTQSLMRQLNILSLPDMLLLNSLKFHYKYQRNAVPDYFAIYIRKAHLTTTTPAKESISGQTERVSISLKNVLIRIETHSMDRFASAVKHDLISKYGMECQDESCSVCQRQSRSLCVNRLLPVNHYVCNPPFIDTLLLIAHLVYQIIESKRRTYASAKRAIFVSNNGMTPVQRQVNI